jgi:hypothetical protein
VEGRPGQLLRRGQDRAARPGPGRQAGLDERPPPGRSVHPGDADVAGYIADHDVPVNPLRAQGYPSIGCQPCTQPVHPGADPRSGRWAGMDKTECGIHL